MRTVDDYLLELIRIPSVSSVSNRPVVEYAQDVLRCARWSTSLTSYVDASGIEKVNLIAAPPGQNPDEPVVDLAFLCHTDTVPPAAGWTAALEPFVASGQVFGCGACDVKGFLACLLTAAVETRGGVFRPGLRIVLTADEETGCLGSHRLLADGRLHPRSLVVGEPTSLHAARAGKGYCLGELIVYGAEAHSAHPSEGRSAIYDAARVIQAIEQLSTELAREQNLFFDPPYTSINVGTINGGTAKNVIPAECRFLVEWRPIPGQMPEFVQQAIESIAQELRQSDPAFHCDFKIIRRQNGFETSADSSLVWGLEHLTGRTSISIPFGS